MRLKSDRSTPAPLLVCLALACAGFGLAEMARLTVNVSPRVQLYSRNTKVHVELRIKRHADNRRLLVAIHCDGELVDGPAEMPHEGADAHPVKVRTYRSLPPGMCEAVAVLETRRGAFVDRARFEILVPE